KSQLLGMAAHDLRNPICGILSSAELLGEEVAAVLAPEQLALLSSIQSACEFMVKLIDDVLDMSSMESGKLRLDRHQADPSALLKYIVGVCTKVARKKRIRIGLEIQGALPKPRLDAGRIRQVLHNLISNAVKFSPLGTTVQVRAAAQEGCLLISVRDEGPGI